MTQQKTYERETVTDVPVKQPETVDTTFVQTTKRGMDEQVGGALTGAVGGAIVGAVVGGPVGAVVGGAIGATAGATVGAIDEAGNDTVIVTSEERRS